MNEMSDQAILVTGALHWVPRNGCLEAGRRGVGLDNHNLKHLQLSKAARAGFRS